MPFGPKKIKVETETNIFKFQRDTLFKIFVKLSLGYSEKWFLSYQNNLAQTTSSELDPCVGGSIVWMTNTGPPLWFCYQTHTGSSQSTDLARETWWQPTSWLRNTSSNLRVDSKRIIEIPCANSRRLPTLEIAAAKFRSYHLLQPSLESLDTSCQHRTSWESVVQTTLALRQVHCHSYYLHLLKVW